MLHKYYIILNMKVFIMIDKIIKFKEKISILKGLSEENIKMIVRDCNIIKYAKGERIIEQGEDTKNVFFLLDGNAKVLVNNKEVGEIKNNQAFGEFSAIAGEKRSATIIATQPCNVISFSLSLEILENEFAGFAGLYKNICYELIAKVDEANKRARK